MWGRGVSCVAGLRCSPSLAAGWATACVNPDLLFLGTVTPTPSSPGRALSVLSCLDALSRHSHIFYS